MQALRAVHERHMTKFKSLLNKMVLQASTEDIARSADLRYCLLALETPQQDSVLGQSGPGLSFGYILMNLVHRESRRIRGLPEPEQLRSSRLPGPDANDTELLESRQGFHRRQVRPIVWTFRPQEIRGCWHVQYSR